MLRSLLQWCGLLVGPITPDPDLEEAAAQVRESLYEWRDEMERHTEEDAKYRPPRPMRRAK